VNIFVSYHFDEGRPERERFIHRVSYHLNRQPDVDCYCYSEGKAKSNWRGKVVPKLKDCDKFVLFLASKLGGTQEDEASLFCQRASASRHSALVKFPDADADKLPPQVFELFAQLPVRVNDLDERAAEECARKVYGRLQGEREAWVEDDGLPLGFPFAYEKVIIQRFVDGHGRWSCRSTWSTSSVAACASGPT
jgi:hypothetical protein